MRLISIKYWIEAMRLRTLPVSVSGVIAGTSCALLNGKFSLVPALLCLIFAVLAQIASNFGNEYFDFRNGLDKKGREGFRRGVTEGDISPEAMKCATFVTLGLAGIVGCATLYYGGLWLLPVGIAIAVFALAYSAGPYPLSHHGLGDIAVVVFFGIVPVTLTCYLQEGDWGGLNLSLPLSVSVGMMAANVLIVNNYRDMEDDIAVKKNTTVVIFGRNVMGWIYLLSGIVSMIILWPLWLELPVFSLFIPVVYLSFHFLNWLKLIGSSGAELNPILGKTALNLLIFSLLILVFSIHI